MRRFYLNGCRPHKDDGTAVLRITGEDVNHIKNVLRMRPGEEIIICNGQGSDFCCIIKDVLNDVVVAEVVNESVSVAELPVKIHLYQGLPKKDKMELIIQKAVELGAASITPVMMKRTVVRLEDEKKELKKLERWQAIAEGAAKQSGRGIIPEVRRTISFGQALTELVELDIAAVPYEAAEGMAAMASFLTELHEAKSSGLLIGPEGGFEDEEVRLAISAGLKTVSLGKRILRTETAGLCMLSAMMLGIEMLGCT